MYTTLGNISYSRYDTTGIYMIYVETVKEISGLCVCSQKVSLKERVFSSPRSSGTKGKGSPQHGKWKTLRLQEEVSAAGLCLDHADLCITAWGNNCSAAEHILQRCICRGPKSQTFRFQNVLPHRCFNRVLAWVKNQT